MLKFGRNYGREGEEEKKEMVGGCSKWETVLEYTTYSRGTVGIPCIYIYHGYKVGSLAKTYGT